MWNGSSSSKYKHPYSPCALAYSCRYVERSKGFGNWALGLGLSTVETHTSLKCTESWDTDTEMEYQNVSNPMLILNYQKQFCFRAQIFFLSIFILFSLTRMMLIKLAIGFLIQFRVERQKVILLTHWKLDFKNSILQIFWVQAGHEPCTLTLVFLTHSSA